MNKKTSILLGFISLKFLLQYFFISPVYELQRDEFLHLDQANHLAWGFQSVPPLTSMIAAIIQFLGNSEFMVRFFPALFGALTIFMVWKTIEELKGNLFALVLGATCVLLSILLRLNSLFQPNTLDVLFWITFYFVLIKYINSENVKWLFIGALVFAFGFLNKYNIFFLLLGLLPAILLSEQRRIFAKKEFYFAIGFGLILISPNLLWQYQNSFPVFHHLKELADTQLVNVHRLDFLKEQFLFFMGALPVIFASFYALLFYKPFKKYQFFFGVMVFTLLIFTYLKAKSYYAIGLYPVYIAFGAVYFGQVLETKWKRIFQSLLIAVPVLCYVLLYKVVFSVQSPEQIIANQKTFKDLGLLRWEDGKDHELPQDFADMLAWKELAAKVEKVYENLPNKEQTMIFCDNYGQAGAINFYRKNEKIRAVSFNADYINWINLDSKITNFVRVIEFEGSEDDIKRTSPAFESGFAADSITNPLAREYKTIIYVFSNPKIDLNKRIKIEMEKEKNY